jgi:hypothetical protein
MDQAAIACTGGQMTASLDLYAEEPVLGGGTSRFVRVAGITFGKLTVNPVADDELSREDRLRPDRPTLYFAQVRVPFDLEDLAAGRHYAEATVRMTFDDPEVRSLRLPRLPEPDGPPDSQTDTWGFGQARVMWKLAARDHHAGIRPGGRIVYAALESPLRTGRITGSLDGTVRCVRTVLGVVSSQAAGPRHPLRFDLDVQEGTFAFLAD